MLHCFFIVVSVTDDPLVKQLFYDAGLQLGKLIIALIPKIDEVFQICFVVA